MRKKTIFPFLVLFFVIMGVLSFSDHFVENFRDKIIHVFFPLWEKRTFPNADSSLLKGKTLAELHQLEIENCLLHEQVEGVYEWLSFEEAIQDDLKKLREVSTNQYNDLYWSEFFRRRTEEKKQILELALQSLPARVVFRDPISWSSSVWINVGSEVNESMGRLIVAKNSPVVIGNSLVGIVEQVKEKFSRVRLITDSGLVPSVRVTRGSSQQRSIFLNAKNLLNQLQSAENISMPLNEKEKLLSSLNQLIQNLDEKKDWYLAKGELHGSSQPLWRSRGALLKGIGFNDDFPDEENIAKKLKIDKPILAKGDLLITTGYDGIFPPGLHVATVEKIKGERKGGHSYEIEARPCVQRIDDLHIVFVMPPLEFSREE